MGHVGTMDAAPATPLPALRSVQLCGEFTGLGNTSLWSPVSLDLILPQDEPLPFFFLINFISE